MDIELLRDVVEACRYPGLPNIAAPTHYCFHHVAKGERAVLITIERDTAEIVLPAA